MNKSGWGGKREGAGRKPLTPEERLLHGSYSYGQRKVPLTWGYQDKRIENALTKATLKCIREEKLSQSLEDFKSYHKKLKDDGVFDSAMEQTEEMLVTKPITEHKYYTFWLQDIYYQCHEILRSKGLEVNDNDQVVKIGK